VVFSVPAADCFASATMSLRISGSRHVGVAGDVCGLVGVRGVLRGLLLELRRVSRALPSAPSPASADSHFAWSA
jgi:hypothetical protein